MKLNLGCGPSKMDGFVNVDRLESVHPDVVCNLDVVPWPFSDASVDHIFSSNAFEHLNDTIQTMEECYRILKPGGTMDVIVPFAMSSGALQDPTHKSFWTDYTVNYFVKGHQANFYTKASFNLIFNRLESNSDTLRCKIRNLIPFRRILSIMIFGMFDHVHFTLEKPNDSARS
jgi:SAM-dependent methyltransferase